ncbi:MAG: hypothetical protein NVSMB32_02500 [Actinomycetota bacterium]
MRYVILDAMGVLYREPGIAGPLTSFAQQRGSSVTVPQARAAYRRASAGEMDSPALWQALGVEGDPDECDRAWLAGRTLMPGARQFLAALRQEGVPVGCITNDLSRWSAMARRANRLDDEINPWIVSAEVGARKPARAIYDVFLSATGCEPEACLFVDDQAGNLDAAEALGFRTAWFAPGASVHEGHQPRVTTFEQLQQLAKWQAVGDQVRGG